MLSTKEAVFHLKFIPTRWYSEEKDNIQEPFLTADKYMQEGQQFVYNNDESGLGLCLFEQVNNEFCDDRLNVLEQRIVYGRLHGSYKKALNKALQNSLKSEQLINLLENFAEDANDNFSDSAIDVNYCDENESSNKENSDPLSPPLLRNPKKRQGKGRPFGTKRFKSTCENPKPTAKNQR